MPVHTFILVAIDLTARNPALSMAFRIAQVDLRLRFGGVVVRTVPLCLAPNGDDNSGSGRQSEGE
eukprot:SAG31_NODE_822_length_11777_cov_11.328738_5_plen_65_part_00